MRGRGGPRFVGWIAVGVATVIACAAAIGDAAIRNTSPRDDTAAAIAHAAPLDLALSFSSRWLRHPSVAEPAAPFSDGPSLLDTDPSGAFFAPHPEHFRGDARELKVMQ